MKTFKKILAIILCVVMVFGSAPLAGFVGLELPSLAEIFTTKAEAATSGYYTYTISSGKATITDCVTSIYGSVTIPSSLDGYEVVSIGSQAFYNCTKLTSITIPNSVTSIGSYAFYSCTSLTSIVIPDSVKSIGERTFYSCTSLTSIVIPDSVKSIGECTFYNCESLTSITVPDSVTSIGEGAFQGCKNLTSVTLSENITSIANYAFYSCTSLTSFAIPDSVTSIGIYTFFSCDSLTSITIGNGVKSIGSYAFFGCGSLTSITIPDSVTSIGWDAFKNCTSLTSITIGNGVSNIGYDAFYNTGYYNNENNWENGVLYIGKHLIDIDKTAISESYNVKEGTLVVAEQAFYYCSSLTSIMIPDSVISINDEAFYGCSSLSSITIGNGVKNIGYGAFESCTSLTDVYYTGSQEQWKKVYILSKNDCLKNSSIVFECISETPYYANGTCGENLTWILYTNSELVISGTGEMTDWINNTSPWDSIKSKIESVRIEDGVTSVGWEAFNGCNNLTSITIPDSITYIGVDAFYNCDSLISITIGNGVTSIGKKAFYNTAYYNNASNWENDVLYIGKYLIDTQKTISGSCKVKEGTSVIADSAFEYRNSLENITLPDSITNIGSGAFKLSNAYFANIYYEGDIADWCKIKISATLTNPMCYTKNFYVNGVLLKELVIPDGITSINFCSFYYCKNITTVTIPKSVKAINNYAFDGCSGIETIYYYGTADEWQNVIIGSCNEYFSQASVVYEYGTENANYGSGAINSTITWTLYENGDLVIEGSGAIPNYSESSVPWYAVRDRIKNVYIPADVTNIGASAFSGCTNIEKFIVDENNFDFVTDEYGVLYNYDKTKLIKYPAKSTNTEYTVPDSVESIRVKAFEEAKNLTSVTLNTGITEIVDSAFIGCSNLVAANYYGTQENWNTVTVGANNESLTNSLVYEYGTENFYYGKGTCGTNLTWVLYGNGSLVISGTGEMTNYYTATPAPWSDLRSKITSIKLQSGVTSIGSSAFSHCINLEKVEIPSSVKSIGEVAFAECDKIKNISVPYGVKTIDGGAFRDCDLLETVVLADSVTTLGNSAFYMCDSLKNVTLSKNIKTIDDYTFYKCISLESIVIPDSVTYIGYYAFYNCSQLNELTMPVTARIYNSYYVFSGCKEIDKITLTKGTTGVMLNYGTSTSSSSTITNYEYTPWYISGCPEVVIADGVKSIGECAFYDCGKLKKLTLPGSLDSMGYMSFYYMNELSDIYFTGTIADWCAITIDNVHVVNHAENFYINGKLVEGDLVIPDGVTYVGDKAFFNVDSITSVTVPDSVTQIGTYAFASCDGITNAKIGNGVTIIEDYAFVECPSMITLVIGNKVTSIGVEAFYGCVSLKELTMPVTAKIYNSSDTFYGCDKQLKKVTLTKGTTGVMQNYGTSTSETASATYYGYTPWGMSDCTEIIIESGVTNIGEYAFCYCTSLENISIPDTVTSIGKYAFRNCGNLTEVKIPDGVTSIPEGMFYFCDGLTKITIPDGVKTIGDGAFYYCDSVKELTMPVSAKISNAEKTFYGCYYIDKIIFTKGIGSMPDYGTSTSTSSSTTYYKYTPWYISGCSEIVLPSGVSSIGKYAFHECSYLTTVTYEGTVDEYYEMLIKDYNEPLFNAKTNFTTYMIIWVYGDKTEKVLLKVGDPIVPPTVEVEEGFECVGWSSEIPEVMPEENLTFIAIIEEKLYKATWIVDGEETTETYRVGQEIVIPGNPEKTGYTFAGWTPEIPERMPMNDLTFNAVFTANSYDAVFNANGGKWSDGSTEKTVATVFDSEIIAPEAPAKQGYVFSSWTPEVGVMDDVNGKTFIAEWIPASDTIYTVETYTMNTCGEYEKNVHTFAGETESTVNADYSITNGFTLNGDKSILSGVIAADNSLVLKVYIDRNIYTFTTNIDGKVESTKYYYDSIIPEIIPEKIGYSFIGWDNEMPVTMPAEDVTITAVFEVNSYDAIFNANGGVWSDGSTEKTVSTEYGSEIVLPENPERKGYIFSTWTPEVGIMDDINGKIFTAKWIPATDTVYTVETYVMNVSGEYDKTVQSFRGTTEEIVVAEYDIPTGFRLNSTNSVISGVIAADSSLVLKVYIDRITYKLTTDVEGVLSTTEYLYGAEISEPEAPEKTGYTFDGWNRAVPATMPAENVTIIAVFSANIYNAVFDANGGVWSDGSTEKTVSASFDSEIIAPENPERTGYVFSKWSPEVGTMDDVNGKTFTAEWIASTDTVYTVEIYTMNTVGEYKKSVQTLNGATDSTVNAEYNVEEGFTFNSKKSIISGVVSADNSLVLKVYIDRNTYTFTTIVDGVSNSTQYLYGSIIPEIIPQKTGYSFIGWDKQVPSTMPAENVTITAVFEVNSYDAVFNANGGSWSDGSTEKTVSTVYGSEIVVPENPERRGYTFDGWDIDIPSVMPAENVVAEAIWTVNTYELTWVVDGVSTKNNIVFGNTITVPENPEKTGYTFIGWTPEVPATMPAEDVTITAVFEVNSYDAIFDANGGVWSDGSTEKTVSTVYGSEIVVPENPVMQGYIFSGWMLGDENIGTNIGVMDDINGKNFVAGWIASTETVYVVETYTMNLNGEYIKSSQTLTGTTNEAVTLAPSVMSGFTLNVDQSVLSGTVKADNSLLLKVYYDRNKYTFTTVANGVSTSTEYYYDSEITIPDAPEKMGYTFVKWDSTIPARMPANDLTVTAVFSINSYNITFSTNGGSWSGGATEKTVSTEYGSKIIVPENPVRKGYTFNGWNVSIPETMPAENIVVQAKWTVNTYELKWIVEDAETVTNVVFGDIIAVPENPEKVGYTFVGWTPEVPTTMPAEDMIITAVFEVNSYDAVFNANGGSWSDGTTEKIVATKYGAEVVTPENPTKQGYVFSKWTPEVGKMDDINGKTFAAEWIASTETVYSVETYIMNTSGEYEKSIQSFKGTTGEMATAKYTVSTGFTFNAAKSLISGVIAADNSLVLKVYIDRNVYTFTTVVDGASTSTKYLYGSIISEPTVPSRFGYKFMGWDKTIPSTMPANDVTVIANFELSFKMEIRNPSTTTISYGDSIVLHADMNEALPSGWTVKWTADNGNFSYSANGETCTITPNKSGDTTFTATVYDENGNEISKDTQTMKSKAGFFDKFAAFFRKLFGMTKVIPQVFNGIF